MLLPGYVAVRLLARELLNAGLLGAIAVSYLATFALLAPISILSYWLSGPTWFLSAACVITVAAAGIYVTYRGWWRDLGRLLALSLSLELAIVLADLLLGLHAGAHLGGDASYHLTRIRYLVDNGLVNQDPYVEFAAPVSVYHTNLYHALLAACVQLTGADVFTVWSSTLAWAKLVAFAGCYLFAWSVFRRTWPAWLVTLAIMAPQMPVTYLLYPNQVSHYWLLTTMMAFAILATEQRYIWRVALLLGAGAFVLGQIHPLYAFFAALIIGPALFVLMLYRAVRRRRTWIPSAVCGLALLVGLPFPLAARAANNTNSAGAATATVEPDAAPAAPATPAPKRTGLRADRYWHFANGWVMVKFAPDWRQITWLVIGLGAGLLTVRQHAIALAVGCGLSVAVMFYVPPVCTFLVDLFGELWILLRLNGVLWVLVVRILTVGVTAYVIERAIEAWWLREDSSSEATKNKKAPNESAEPARALPNA